MEPEYTIVEEQINALIYGIGVVLSIVGLAVLVTCAAIYGNAWHVVSFSIFGTTLIILYAASTLYHSMTHTTAKRVFWIAKIFKLLPSKYSSKISSQRFFIEFT